MRTVWFIDQPRTDVTWEAYTTTSSGQYNSQGYGLEEHSTPCECKQVRGGILRGNHNDMQGVRPVGWGRRMWSNVYTYTIGWAVDKQEMYSALHWNSEWKHKYLWCSIQIKLTT